MAERQSDPGTGVPTSRDYTERQRAHFAAAINSRAQEILRFFPWPRTPTAGDYRALLATVRNNAERET